MTHISKIPVKIVLHKASKELELRYDDAEYYRLSAEYLRVMSPSAEVRGHGSGDGELPTGKKHVGINHVKAAGNYALQIIFDDGHDSGIYEWQYLYDLCRHEQNHWDDYLAKLHAAGAGRDPAVQVIRL